jgi:hypothetical protein
LVINGYNTEELTAISHSDPSDPWFHFYWPGPGEQVGYSWWPYDDRNNPSIHVSSVVVGGVTHIVAVPVNDFSPSGAPAQPAIQVIVPVAAPPVAAPPDLPPAPRDLPPVPTMVQVSAAGPAPAWLKYAAAAAVLALLWKALK